MRAALLVTGLLSCMAGTAGRAGADEVADQQVARSIERGVAWLRNQQSGDGSWGGIKVAKGLYRYPAGPTALALFALLAGGVAPDDPQIKRGFDYIHSYYRIPGSNYEVAFLMLALCAKAENAKGKLKLKGRDRGWIKALAAKLAAEWKDGGWRYGSGVQSPGGFTRDLCHTQFAVLALYGARELGVKIPRKILGPTIDWVLKEQGTAGPARGWSYARASSVANEKMTTGAMTTGGVVTLLLAGAMLESSEPREHAKRRSRIAKGIADGLMWIEANWSTERNPSQRETSSYHLLHMYGLERVGAITGKQKLAGRDWFGEGSRWLVAHQQKDGAWDRNDTHAPHQLINTSFALLFLSRATRRIAKN